jgi:hypothetical protein
MKLHEKMLIIIGPARAVPATHNPMTIRQVYYQLVFSLQSKEGPL